MSKELVRIDVAATIIYRGEEILTTYNSQWGAFTLPMTKVRPGQLGAGEHINRWELGAEAAMRNVAESLGITSVESTRLLMDFADLRQSDRSDKLNHYAFQIFGYPVEEKQVGSAVTASWLTPNEILDPLRQPISPTARALIAGLNEAAFSRKTQFPPPEAKRKSVSSTAILSRGEKSKKAWLCQWNEHWGRYFLVGGHHHQGESPEACIARELKEELDLDAGDFQCQPRELLEYEAWSTSQWQMTDYTISPFDIELNRSAEEKLGGNPANVADPANRWVTAEEIRSDRCRDDKLISPTARMILTRLEEL